MDVNVAWWCSGTGEVWVWRYTPFVGVWVVASAMIGGWLMAHHRAGAEVERRLLRRWVAGVAAIFVVSEWPLGQLGAGYLATVGVGRYVVLTFVAAPLLVSALPEWLLGRWLPPGSRRANVVDTLTRWPVALVVFNVVLFGTHLPVVLDMLKITQLGSFANDVAQLTAGVIWWWPAIRREPHRNRIEEPGRAFYLFASSVLMFVPAAFLTFSPLPLYGLYELAPPLWLSFDPVQDQQAAGITMNVVGGLVLWIVIAVLFLKWARQQQRDDIDARRRRDAARIATFRGEGTSSGP